MCVINITCSKITGLHKNKHGLDYHYLQILLHPIGRHLLFLSVLKTLFLNLVLHLWSFWRLLPPLRVRRLRRRWGGQGGRGVGGSLELLRVLSFPVLTFHLLPSFQIVSLTMVGESAAPLPGTARGLTVWPSQDKCLQSRCNMILYSHYPKFFISRDVIPGTKILSI